MDKTLFVAMNGASATFDRAAKVAHNLANANTTGFRAELLATKALYAQADHGLPTRVFTEEAAVGFRSTAGALMATGNPLNVAIKGDGWLAVQDASKKEAYTRAGEFQINPEGVLVTTAGNPVVGESGPITVPLGVTDLTFAADGTLSGVQNGKSTQLGKLKLVNPPVGDLVRGNDGLIRTKAGQAVAQNDAVKIAGGMIEGSNVSVVEEMTRMIEVQRRLEMQMKFIQTAELNHTKATQILGQ